MNELRQVLDACRDAGRSGERAVLATVVEVTGSAYRRPGARMLIPAAGFPVGVVSGGCLEEDLAERAREVLDSGPRTVVYDMRSPDDIVWGLGLGCNGEIRVLLEPVAAGELPPHLGFIERCCAERRTSVVATVYEVEGDSGLSVGQRLLVSGAGTTAVGDEPLRRIDADARLALGDGRSRVVRYDLPAGTAAVLHEHTSPPVRLLVFGAGSDAEPLVRLAGEIGWEVTIVDHRPAFARVDRFPATVAVRCAPYDRLAGESLVFDDRTPAVVMTHHFLHDLEILEFLLATEAPYIGLIGPRKRTENLRRELARKGAGPDLDAWSRVHGPVGIDIGAETPVEIALSVLAEVQAVLLGRGAGFLRQREGPLHDWSR